MKNNNEDKLIAGKIDKLDTLAGGIVYGKEEAWEKLQARLEQKPVKKIRLQYWLAAAAMLLLFVSITGVYNHSAKQKTFIVKTEKTQVPVQSVVPPEPNLTQVAAESRTITVHHTISTVSKEIAHKKPAVKEEEEPIKPQIIAVQPVQVAINENKTGSNVLPAPTHVKPLVKTMKVVHINELNGKVIQDMEQNVFDNNGPAVVISKLPVTHINDMVREVNEIKEIRQGNRLVFRHKTLYSHEYYDNGNLSNNSIYYQPPVFLRSIFSKKIP